MLKQGFLEYRTQFLTSSKIEGARDFGAKQTEPWKILYVPQAPQQFKQ